MTQIVDLDLVMAAAYGKRLIVSYQVANITRMKARLKTKTSLICIGALCHLLVGFAPCAAATPTLELFLSHRCALSVARLAALIAPLQREFLQYNTLELKFRLINLTATAAEQKELLALACADEQHAFLPLFFYLGNTSHVDLEHLHRILVYMGINLREYKLCLANPHTEQRYAADRIKFDQYKLTGLPSMAMENAGAYSLSGTYSTVSSWVRETLAKE